MGISKKQRDKIWSSIPQSFIEQVIMKLPWTEDESCNMDYKPEIKTEIDTYKYVKK